MVMVGPPKKHLLPLFVFLLFLCALFFLYSSSPSLNLTPSNFDQSSISQTFPLNPHPVPSTFTFLVKVLTFNRLHSLSRCLHSLAAARYGADRVHLHVYVDHFVLDQSTKDDQLEESRRILEFVDRFEWKFGDKVVHYRTSNAGLQAQWLEAWWPSSEDEFAFVVEDDLQVSPLYYEFLKSVIRNYYYNSSNFSPSIYGASLQRPRFVPGKHGNKIQLDSGTRLFLYQIVGTWGQLLFPKPWKEFRLWYDEHKAKGMKPFLEGMVTTGWYKKMGERIWTPWFIKFIHSRGYFNIYTNFLHERALSVSHRDAGVNYGKTIGPDSQLLNETSLDFNFLEMQPLNNLKWYDFCFREVHPGRVVRNLDELGTVLMSVQRQETVLFVSLFGVSEIVTRNILCHFERLNTQNYIFFGPHSDLLFDLARRGHTVIDVDQFVNDAKVYKLTRFRDSNAELMKEILVKAYIIKKCMDYRYNMWFMNSNMLFAANDVFLEAVTPTLDIYIGKNMELFFSRSSSSMQKIWTDDFFNNFVTMLNKVSSNTESRKFGQVVPKLLEQMGVKIGIIDEANFAVNIGTSSINQTSSGTGKKIFYWSSEIGSDIIAKRLKELNMWLIDGDFSCTAVVCHQ